MEGICASVRSFLLPASCFLLPASFQMSSVSCSIDPFKPLTLSNIPVVCNVSIDWILPAELLTGAATAAASAAANAASAALSGTFGDCLESNDGLFSIAWSCIKNILE
jgi:hypothetical protein